MGNYQVEQDLPPGLGGDSIEVVDPQEVLASRIVSQHGEQLHQFLVQ